MRTIWIFFQCQSTCSTRILCTFLYQTSWCGRACPQIPTLPTLLTGDKQDQIHELSLWWKQRTWHTEEEPKYGEWYIDSACMRMRIYWSVLQSYDNQILSCDEKDCYHDCAYSHPKHHLQRWYQWWMIAIMMARNILVCHFFIIMDLKSKRPPKWSILTPFCTWWGIPKVKEHGWGIWSLHLLSNDKQCLILLPYCWWLGPATVTVVSYDCG